MKMDDSAKIELKKDQGQGRQHNQYNMLGDSFDYEGHSHLPNQTM